MKGPRPGTLALLLTSLVLSVAAAPGPLEEARRAAERMAKAQSRRLRRAESRLAEVEATPSVRWVWSDAPRWYADLLAAGVRVARCHDLRLCLQELAHQLLELTHDIVRTCIHNELGCRIWLWRN